MSVDTEKIRKKMRDLGVSRNGLLGNELFDLLEEVHALRGTLDRQEEINVAVVEVGNKLRREKEALEQLIIPLKQRVELLEGSLALKVKKIASLEPSLEQMAERLAGELSVLTWHVRHSCMDGGRQMCTACEILDDFENRGKE